mgnify:CR=1 FL=1
MKETIITLAAFFFIFVFIVAFEFIMVGDMVKQELPIETTTTEQDEE